MMWKGGNVIQREKTSYWPEGAPLKAVSGTSPAGIVLQPSHGHYSFPKALAQLSGWAAPYPWLPWLLPPSTSHQSENPLTFRNSCLYTGIYCFMEVKRRWPMLQGCLFLSVLWCRGLPWTGWSWWLLQAKWGVCLLLNLRVSLLLVCYIYLWVQIGVWIPEMAISCTELPPGYSGTGTKYALRGKPPSPQVWKQGLRPG